MIKFYDNGNGYKKSSKCGYLHRYLWICAYGEIPSGYVIHHKNGEKDDNRLENLDCVADLAHRRIHGRGKRTKLSQDTIALIKGMHERNIPISKICKMLKIANATAWDYAHGNKRRHIRKRSIRDTGSVAGMTEKKTGMTELF